MALIDETKADAYKKMNLQQLAAEMQKLKQNADDLEDVAKAAKAEYEYLSKILVPEKMDDEGVQSMVVAGVGRLQKRSELQCNVLASDREPLHQWLKSNGFEALVSETVNSSTLKAWVKERMKQAEEYPSDLINVHPYQVATVVKA